MFSSIFFSSIFPLHIQLQKRFILYPKRFMYWVVVRKHALFFTEVHYFLKSSILNELPPKRFLCKE